MEEFTYEQIRAKALRQGVKDNKVHIGLWANLNNYLKTRRKKNGNSRKRADAGRSILTSGRGLLTY